MRAPGGVLAPLLGLALAWQGLAGQTPVGRLLYVNPTGRGLTLTLLDGGSAAQMRLKSESGDAKRLRDFVARRSGLELRVAANAAVLGGSVPAGWKAGGNGQGSLLEFGDTVWWRYAPGLVVPARFIFDRQIWSLSSADVPARLLVADY